MMRRLICEFLNTKCRPSQLLARLGHGILYPLWDCKQQVLEEAAEAPEFSDRTFGFSRRCCRWSSLFSVKILNEDSFLDSVQSALVHELFVALLRKKGEHSNAHLLASCLSELPKIAEPFRISLLRTWFSYLSKGSWWTVGRELSKSHYRGQPYRTPTQPRYRFNRTPIEVGLVSSTAATARRTSG